MKKALVLIMMIVFAFFYIGFESQAFYTWYEDDDANYDMFSGQFLTGLDGASFEGARYNAINGHIQEQGDDDAYKFHLYRYVELTISMTESFNFDHTICIYYHREDTVGEQAVCGSDLSSGIMLTPGTYYIHVGTDGPIFFPAYYGDRYPYTIEMVIDPDTYHEANYETFDLYDEMVKNLKVAVWTNNYDPTHTFCAFDGDCQLIKYYNGEYLYQKIYSYDPQFTYFLSAMFNVLAEVMLDLYDENLQIQNTYDVVSNVFSTIANVGISYYIPNKKAASIVSKISTFLIDNTFNTLASNQIQKLNNQVIFTTPFLGVSMENNDYFCDSNNDGYDDSPDVYNSMKCLAEKAVKDYYDIVVIETMIRDLYHGQTLGEFASILERISHELLVSTSLMRKDDQVVIDVYKELDMFALTRRITTSVSNVLVNTHDTKMGSQSGEGFFSSRLLSDDMIIDSYHNTDYGDFEFYYSDINEFNDGAEPIIYFPNPLMETKSNYTGFDTLAPENKSRLMLIEIGSPNPLDQLARGVTAYDYGHGFLYPELKSNTGFSQYYDYRNGSVGQAVFRVEKRYIDQNTQQLIVIPAEKIMYYLTYRWEYPYKKQEYKYVDSWQPIYTGTAYFTYPHSGFEQIQGSTKYVYGSTGSPDYYYKRENFKYYDYSCFNIYKKRNKLLVFEDDVFAKSVCYYIDERPNSTNVNDYDYQTYYTSSSAYSMASLYIGNSWNVDNVDGATRKVFMDPRTDVALGDYFVKTISNYDDHNIKYVNDTYSWLKSPVDGKVGDYFYFYYKQSSGTFTDAFGSVRSASARYGSQVIFYGNYGYYMWVDMGGLYYFVNKPADTSSTRYILTSYSRRQRFQAGAGE